MTVKNIFFTDESVKMQITGSISENLTDSDLESKADRYNIKNWLVFYLFIIKRFILNFKKMFKYW